jgi:hypothetical protein
MLFASCPAWASLSTQVTLAPGAQSPDATQFISGIGTATGTLTSNFGDSSYYATGTAIADYGVLKAYAQVTLENYLPNSYHSEGCGGFGCYLNDPVYATAEFTDSLTITGGIGTAYLVVTLDIDGSTEKTSDLGIFSTAQGGATIYGDDNVALNTGFFGGTYTFNSEVIPFTYGVPILLRVGLSAFSVAVDTLAETGGNPYSHRGTADFLNTAKLSSLAVYADSGMSNPASFAVSASSGTVFPTILDPAAVPEPSAWIMLAMGGGALGIRGRFGKQ